MAEKKTLIVPTNVKRTWIEPTLELPIAAQCRLCALPRSSYYATPIATESAENLSLMRTIDRLYTAHPEWGVPRITDWMHQHDIVANHKRIARLMRLMGLQAIMPGPHTSRPHPEHVVFPYLLRGRSITTPDQVWCTDITYLPLAHGFLYLVAIMDWFSRYVLAWELSQTLELGFCLSALKKALRRGTPSIFNTDQGSQFTSIAFTEILLEKRIQISMSGRGACFDNIMIERLWRTVKYEHVYLHEYSEGNEMRDGLTTYFKYYNNERAHQSLERKTPGAFYRSRPRS